MVPRNSVLCRFFNPREVQALWSRKYAPHYSSAVRVSSVDNAMPLVIVLGMTGTIYTSYIPGMKERKQKKQKKKSKGGREQCRGPS